MQRQELFEFAATLAAKNMTLEEEIKRLELQLDEKVKIINAYNDHFEDDDDFDYDYDSYPSMEEEAKNVLDEIESETYLSHRIVELEKRVQELDRWTVAQSNLADRVSELEEKVDSYGK